MIKFWRTRDEYGFLSNFSKHPVTIDGKRWPTTEHYYQAMKFTDELHQEQVRKAAGAKRTVIAKGNGGDLRDKLSGGIRKPVRGRGGVKALPEKCPW